MSGGSLSESSFLVEKSKNGEETCSFSGKYLHSKYNPLAEAEKFVQNIEADFFPECLFILEPALSYCALPLKKRFPKTKFFAIRYVSFFKDTDSKWDKVFYLDDNLALSDRLFNYFGEEKLYSSLFFEWPASKQIFSGESSLAWSEIKKAILKSRDVLGTRAYFSKRWFKNSLIFASSIKNPVTIKKINLPVIIASSGPSLRDSLPYLKEFRNSFFLISVSSAFQPLFHNGIIPDLVISSDGGYWAKKHLEFPAKDCSTIFALETESAVPKKILEKQKIIPLIYEDSQGKDFLDALKMPYMLSERCGTVAGTALTFALSLTENKVYLCGQDLAPSAGFQHTQPNALENGNAQKDFRLKNTETRITRSRFNSSQSLEIYRNWFISNSDYFSSRVMRLSDNYKYDFSLGKIKDINWNDFEKTTAASKSFSLITDKNTEKNAFLIEHSKKLTNESEESVKTRNKYLLQKLIEISKKQRFIDEVFTMDSILIHREISELKKQELIKKTDLKVQEFIRECEKIL